MAIVIAELYWLRMLLRDLHIHLSSLLVLWYCDNLGALSLEQTQLFMLARTKHIEVDYHFIREKVPHRYVSFPVLMLS